MGNSCVDQDHCEFGQAHIDFAPGCVLHYLYDLGANWRNKATTGTGPCKMGQNLCWVKRTVLKPG